MSGTGPEHSWSNGNLSIGLTEPLVRTDLESGRLRQLEIEDWWGGSYPFWSLTRTADPPGPAANWLLQHLAEKLCEASDVSAPADATASDDRPSDGMGSTIRAGARAPGR
jgi:hypothetical protein